MMSYILASKVILYLVAKIKIDTAIPPVTKKIRFFTNRLCFLLINCGKKYCKYLYWMKSNIEINSTTHINPIGGGKSAPASIIAFYPKKNTIVFIQIIFKLLISVSPFPIVYPSLNYNMFYEYHTIQFSKLMFIHMTHFYIFNY